ncbi:serine hydrolase domain-containing protein [Enterococcus sp. CSURQ0835]|uniref:serine hydrolase domain-containing protein n=1 Tax=Enterococcus sp. CSURQ0835 TaxID=2681394 RepID=UPI001F20F1E5|nr:serine hydrolase domain-containing protein [Enterococcus sp. CSURQ0835]
MRMRKRRKRKIITATLIVSFGLLGIYFLLAPTDRAEQETAVTTSTVQPRPKAKKQALKKTVAEPFPVTIKAPAIDAYLKTIQFSGTALIVKNAQVVVSQGYGFANQAEQKINQPQTRFLIGSAQKAIIATAVLQLVEQKKWQLDDPVSRFIPDFPNGEQITLKNLLNHTSGIAGRQLSFGAITPLELVQEIEQAGIRQAPGTWRYLDSNYEVLAYLIEKITQKPLATYLASEIFTPAEMNGAVEGQAFYQQANAATSYKWNGGQLQEAEVPDLSQEFGAGDLSMTASDLYRFDQALMTGKLLKEPEKTAMLTPGSSSSYGMGFYVNPASYMNHGVLGGFNTINSISKDGSTYILLLGNTNTIASLGQAVDHIYTLLS